MILANSEPRGEKTLVAGEAGDKLETSRRSSRSLATAEAVETGSLPPIRDARGSISAAAAAAGDVERGGGTGADHDTIPDGGLEAWLQVLGSWVILVDTWGLVNSFGVFQTHYENVLLKSSSPSAISWIGSLQGSLLMLVGVVSGPLFDAGYFRVLVAAGLFLIVLGQFMTSLCSEYWQVLLAQGVAVGLGMGLTFLPSAAILSQYFRKRRALVLGISSTGSPIAGIVIPIIFSRLEPTMGFGWATRVIAFVLLAISVIPVACMHTRVPPAPSDTATGGPLSSQRVRTTREEEEQEEEEKENVGRATALAARLFDATALREGPFVAVVLGAFFAFLVLYVPFFYAQLFAETHGVAGPDVSPYFVTLLNAGSIIGRVLPNYVADRAGSVNVVAACSGASAVLLLGWFGVRDFAGFVVFTVLYGGFSGGIVSVMPNVIMSLTPDRARVGVRMGMVFLFTGVAILIGTPVAGAIVAGYGEERWRATIGYSAGGLLVGALFFSLSRLSLYRKNRHQWKA